MPISERILVPGEIVRLPFPYADAGTRQHRPALVVATLGEEGAPPLLWVLMITSAENRRRRSDIEIPDAKATGLPIPSVIRTAKIATVDAARAEARGRVAPRTLAAVRDELGRRLGLQPALQPAMRHP